MRTLGIEMKIYLGNKIWRRSIDTELDFDSVPIKITMGTVVVRNISRSPLTREGNCQRLVAKLFSI